MAKMTREQRVLAALQADPDVELMSPSRATRAQRKSLRDIPWTAGPQNRRQKIARALWG